jgi:PAS domain S-box-containing protein
MAQDHIAKPPRVSRLVIVVCIISIAATWMTWFAVKASESSHIRATSRLAALTVRSDLASDMEDWIHAEVSLAKLWEFEEPSYDKWSSIANLYIEHHPGCMAIAWFDLHYPTRRWEVRSRFASAQEILDQSDDMRAQLLRDASQSRNPLVSAVRTSPRGQNEFLVVVPIYHRDEFRGFILSSFDLQQSVDTMLGDVMPLRFYVSIHENGREIYRFQGSDENYRAGWSEPLDVDLPGTVWHLQVWPSAQAMATMQSIWPVVTLFFGALLTLVLTRCAQMYAKIRMEIAERRRVEAELRSSQARFSGILELSADAVISTDAHQRISLFNQSAEAMFGYTAEEAIGQPLDIIVPAHLREIHHRHFMNFALSQRKNLLMSERRPITGLRKDGTEFPIAASISKLHLNGEAIFTIICSDITQRVRAEEELRRAHDELEARVLERTADLKRANLELQSEITERKQVEEAVRELSGRVMRVQDEERRHLARELHDGATQNLVAVSLALNNIRRLLNQNNGAGKIIQDCLDILERSTNELRTISYLLHPPMLEEFGLARTLSSYVDGFSKRSGIAVTLDMQPELERLDPEIELTLFRIVQEALANIHRHSGSPTAAIALACEDHHVNLEIRDRGKGIPSIDGNTGVGIAGMRERVRLLHGRLEIQTGSSGTCISIVLPLEEGPAPVISDDSFGAWI